MISIVVPIRNEAENIAPLVQQVQEAMQQPWELLFVDDGSTDASAALIRQEQSRHPQIRLLSFSQNFGQSAAFDAGFRAARGSIVVTLDGDLQNDPRDIPLLLRLLDEGADMVVGWRKHRKDPFSKRLVSKLSNYLRRRAGLDHVHDTGCSLKAFRKGALNQIRLFHGLHRFLPALFIIEGFVVREVVVNHRPRLKGKSKYHFWNRNLGPIIDLFAVSWMARKKLRYTVYE